MEEVRLIRGLIIATQHKDGLFPKEVNLTIGVDNLKFQHNKVLFGLPKLKILNGGVLKDHLDNILLQIGPFMMRMDQVVLIATKQMTLLMDKVFSQLSSLLCHQLQHLQKRWRQNQIMMMFQIIQRAFIQQKKPPER